MFHSDFSEATARCTNRLIAFCPSTEVAHWENREATPAR